MNKQLTKYFAVIDLGSNSFNLIIAKRENFFFTIIKRINLTVQLAKYLDDNDFITPEGVERCLQALSVLNFNLQEFGDDIEIRANATYTIRKAKNSAELLEQAKKIIPWPINIFTGEQEALTIFKGISLSYPWTEKFIACDIGGGSTEIILSDDLEPVFYNSNDIGCVSFTKRFFPNGEISRQAYNEAYHYANQILSKVSEIARQKDFFNLRALGSSGTVKACTQLIKSKLENIENTCKSLLEQFNLTDSQVLDKASQCLKLVDSFKAKQINQKPRNYLVQDDIRTLANLVVLAGSTEMLIKLGIDLTGREVLIGGLAILEALFHSFKYKQLYYSDTALREGVLFQDFSYKDVAKTREHTIENYKQNYIRDTKHLNIYTKYLQALAKANNLNISDDEIATYAIFILAGCYLGEDRNYNNAYNLFKGSILYGFNESDCNAIHNLLTNLKQHNSNVGNVDLAKLAAGAHLTYFLVGTPILKYIEEKKIEVKLHSSNQVEIVINDLDDPVLDIQVRWTIQTIDRKSVV